MAIIEEDEVRALDGHRLKSMIASALSWLRQHQEEVNALNVFPVPDGDTGTNMTLTMTSAWEEIADIEEPHAGRLLTKVAHGALMGARGNSGVILSQIWRGFAYGLDGHRTLTVDVLAEALQIAAETAYKGVVKPVEGTILTVVREISEEASVASEETEDVIEAFERIVKRAEASVARTPSLLPVLRQAGVVDSGGQGLRMIFEGMLRDLEGLPVSETAMRELEMPVLPADLHASLEGELEFDRNYPYDVQFALIGHELPIAQIRSDIESMGDCPLTVGDATAIKVHVHVADPGRPISYGAQYGSVRDVVVEDMRVQYETFVAARSAARQKPAEFGMPVHLLGSTEPPPISVVVVASGEGLADVFRSLGATHIVEGGQTMNPSTSQILEAVEDAESDQVLVLPNNKNVLMAAQQAAEVSEKQVIVVPTRSVPQGVSALLALDQGVSIEENAAAMTESSRDVITAEVTRATRDVEINGLQVQEGDAIGLLEDELVVDAQSFAEAVRWLLAEAEIDDRELITLYYGEEVTEEEAQALADALAEAYPDMEFEVIEGGQPHYPYLISIE
ncbi:MAG: DAK2 domain-containing protein [Anaerolineae bacterium]